MANVTLQELWNAISPRIGTIATFMLGSFTGGLFMSKDFTVQKGDFLFSTMNDDHAFELMKDSYSERVKHLLNKSRRNLENFESGQLRNNFVDI